MPNKTSNEGIITVVSVFNIRMYKFTTAAKHAVNKLTASLFLL